MSSAAACHPRFVYSGCSVSGQSGYTAFYAVTLPFHLLTAVVYGGLFVLAIPRTWADAVTLAALMRASVVGFSVFGALHHISLLRPEPLLTRPLTEILYNAYCSLIYVTLMQLLRTWLLASERLAPQGRFRLRVADAATLVLQTLVVLAVFVFDAALFLSPELDPSRNINVQYYLWGSACLLIGALFAVFALACERRMRAATLVSSRRLLFVFRAIYATYLTLCGPYAALYVVLAAYGENYPAVWFLGHGAFNFAGPVTAAVLFPLLRPEAQRLAATKNPAPVAEGVVPGAESAPAIAEPASDPSLPDFRSLARQT
jgi:hypothetical protein